MHFPAKLHGGPYDGDFGVYIGAELPPVLWAFLIPDCDCGGPLVHWADDPITAAEYGGVKYVYDSIEDGTENVAVYVYAELDYDGILREESETIHA